MNDRITYAVATLAGLILLALLGWTAWAGYRSESDEVQIGADLCPIDPAETPAHVTFLLDVSDAIIGRNTDEVSRRIHRVADSLPRYGKLSIFDVHDLGEPVVAICRPPSDAECNVLTENCREIGEAYRRDFTDPLSDRMAEFFGNQISHNTSPLIEAIRDVSSLTDFAAMPDGSKRLYIVSDMLQHTPGVYSHHRRPLVDGSAEFEELRNREFYALNEPNLNGIEVNILYMLRRQYRTLQNDSHKMFWEQYFTAAGADYREATDINFIAGEAR